MTDDTPMVKNGRLTEGESPSEISGKRSDKIVNGVAVSSEDPGLDKAASEADLDIPIS